MKTTNQNNEHAVASARLQAVTWGVNSTWAQEMIGCVVSGHASTCAIEENNDDISASLPKIAKPDLG